MFIFFWLTPIILSLFIFFSSHCLLYFSPPIPIINKKQTSNSHHKFIDLWVNVSVEKLFGVCISVVLSLLESVFLLKAGCGEIAGWIQSNNLVFCFCYCFCCFSISSHSRRPYRINHLFIQFITIHNLFLDQVLMVKLDLSLRLLWWWGRKKYNGICCSFIKLHNGRVKFYILTCTLLLNIYFYFFLLFQHFLAWYVNVPYIRFFFFLFHLTSTMILQVLC